MLRRTRNDACSSPVEAIYTMMVESQDASGDRNTYTLGRIGRHNVVLAYMPGMSQINSTTVAAHFNKSFPKIWLGLVVGICGGVHSFWTLLRSFWVT